MKCAGEEEGRKGGEGGYEEDRSFAISRTESCSEDSSKLDIHFFIEQTEPLILLYSYYTPTSTSLNIFYTHPTLSSNGHCKTHQRRPAPSQGPLQACWSVRPRRISSFVPLTPRVDEARGALTRELHTLGSTVDLELRERMTTIHSNAAALDNQSKSLRNKTTQLAKTTKQWSGMADGARGKLKVCSQC